MDTKDKKSFAVLWLNDEGKIRGTLFYSYKDALKYKKSIAPGRDPRIFVSISVAMRDLLLNKE